MRTSIINTKWIIALAGAAALIGGVACGGDKDRGVSTNGEPPAVQEGRDAPIDGDFASGERQTDDSFAPGGDVASGGGVAAPDTESGTSGGGQGAGIPALLDRKMIMTATLTIETEEVSKRFEEIGNIAAGAGGFVTSSSFGNTVAGTDGERQQTASITIRIPGEGYQRALVDLRKLGEVTLEQSGSNDVTEEYTDLESRLRGLRAVEAQYVEFLTRAATIEEVLTVQDRLNSVRVEIEQVQGRINLLANQTDLATITVHLEPPPIVVEPPKDGGSITPLEALENGWEASLAVLGGIAVVALAVLAFSWWLIPVGIAAFFVARKLLRSEPARPAPIEPPTVA